MSLNNLKIDINPKFDKDDNVYHIGKLKAPISIDLSQGVTFLIFLAVSGEEELQIAVNDKESANFSRLKVVKNKIKIEMDKRVDKDDRAYYVCKVRYPGVINCFEEACFLAFTSREENEELQITGLIELDDKSGRSKRREIEILRR